MFENPWERKTGRGWGTPLDTKNIYFYKKKLKKAGRKDTLMVQEITKKYFPKNKI